MAKTLWILDLRQDQHFAVLIYSNVWRYILKTTTTPPKNGDRFLVVYGKTKTRMNRFLYINIKTNGNSTVFYELPTLKDIRKILNYRVTTNGLKLKNELDSSIEFRKKTLLS